jgi:hypothetical protein
MSIEKKMSSSTLQYSYILKIYICKNKKKLSTNLMCNSLLLVLLMLFTIAAVSVVHVVSIRKESLLHERVAVYHLLVHVIVAVGESFL